MKSNRKLSIRKILLATLILGAMNVSAKAPASNVERNYVYTNKVTAKSPLSLTPKKLLLVGKEPQIRAMEPYSGSKAAVQRYASVANEYKRRLGDKVNVYCMPIPPGCAFYTPDAGLQYSKSTRPRMLEMFDALNANVIAVDIYPALGRHASEPIYTRTDHHWGALGAYYAAERLASAAGVPFRTIEHFNKQSIPGYVGTMAGFTGSPAVKRSPETFVYYTPKDNSYTTTITDLANGGRTAKTPRKGTYFHKASGSGAYGVYGGGDMRIIKVNTGLKNGRKVAIIKDSMGNAIAPWLFGSFEEVHVIDSRYFPYNIVKYINSNGITDVVLCNNMLLGGTKNITDNLTRYLNK